MPRRKILIVISALLFVVAVIITLIVISKNAQNDLSNSLDADNSKSTVSNIKDDNSKEQAISDVNSEVFNETSNENLDLETSEPKELFHGWFINNYGYTYVYGDCGYEQFNYKDSALNRYANCMNNLSSKLSNKAKIYNMIVPVSSTFAAIPREIYTTDNFYNQSQSSFVSTVSSKFDSTIENISLVSSLESLYDNGEYVYFRTDRNWTQLGAYYAYKAFCEKHLLTPYSLESFSSKNMGEFLGSFYIATSHEDMANNPDEFVCYNTIPTVSTVLTVYDNGKIFSDYKLCENSVSKTNMYDIFVGKNAGRYEVNTNAGENSLLIIGDSSVFPIVPFLASHYYKIDIINPEKFDMSLDEFMSGREYDAVLTMCYSTNAVSGNYVPSLNTILGVNTDE